MDNDIGSHHKDLHKYRRFDMGYFGIHFLGAVFA